jgi:adenylosuccinate lyase
MSTHSIDALSPLDGRYARKLAAARALFSEAGLMRERVRVECAWFLALSAGPAKDALARLPHAAVAWLESLSKDPRATDVAAIKEIESRINHDVKAVEYWIRDQLRSRGATAAELEWVHFGCTSEDINNLAYALMLKNARGKIVLPMLDKIGAQLDSLRHRHAAVGMLARTHGQAATPTTVGKELANVAARLHTQRTGIERVTIMGKMNGAVGNFNAHVAALPQVDWLRESAAFVESLGLQSNAHTTQIEPHDWIAEYCHAIMRADTVLLDFSRDMWSYISLGYFKQRLVDGEVGSRTPRAIWDSRTHCSAILRTSCPSHACSEISPIRRYCAMSASPSDTPPSPINPSTPASGRSNSMLRALPKTWTAPGRCSARRCKR